MPLLGRRGRLYELVKQVLMLDDTPHSIALGWALGIFVGVTPTVGVQVILVTLITLFIRANRLAACVAVYVSNPLTIVPIYWLNYWIGTFFVPHRSLSSERFVELLGGGTGWWDRLWTLMIDMAGPMWTGSLLLGTVCAAPSYPLALWVARRYRAHRPIERAANPENPSDESLTRAAPETSGRR